MRKTRVRPLLTGLPLLAGVWMLGACASNPLISDDQIARAIARAEDRPNAGLIGQIPGAPGRPEQRLPLASKSAEPENTNPRSPALRAPSSLATAQAASPTEALWLTQIDPSSAGSLPDPTQADRQGDLPDLPSAAASQAPSTRPTFSLKRDLKNLPRTVWADTKRVYTNPKNLAILLLAGGTSLALRPEVDDDIEDKFDRNRALRSEWGDVAGVLGNPGLHFGLAGLWYLAGLQSHDAKTYKIGKDLFSALIINGLSTELLKVAAHTQSPNGERYAWPSGHVSSSFCLAAVMDRAYGPLVGWPLYGLAGFVAFERMDDREHHFSDVIFGAALGLVIGHTVASGEPPEILGGTVLPYADPAAGTSGIAWHKAIR